MLEAQTGTVSKRQANSVGPTVGPTHTTYTTEYPRQDEEPVKGGLFARLGFSAATRGFFFYCICIWVRSGIAALAWYYADKDIGKTVVPIVCIVVGSFAIYLNLLNRKRIEGQWWNRTAHGVSGIALLAVSIIVLVDDGLITQNSMGYVLFADVVFGFCWSLIKCPFRSS